MALALCPEDLVSFVSKNPSLIENAGGYVAPLRRVLAFGKNDQATTDERRESLTIGNPDAHRCTFFSTLGWYDRVNSLNPLKRRVGFDLRRPAHKNAADDLATMVAKLEVAHHAVYVSIAISGSGCIVF